MCLCQGVRGSTDVASSSTTPLCHEQHTRERARCVACHARVPRTRHSVRTRAAAESAGGFPIFSPKAISTAHIPAHPPEPLRTTPFLPRTVVARRRPPLIAIPPTATCQHAGKHTDTRRRSVRKQKRRKRGVRPSDALTTFRRHLAPPGRKLSWWRRQSAHPTAILREIGI